VDKRNLNWNSVYSVKGLPCIIGLGGLLIRGLISSSDESDDDEANILSKLLIQEFNLFISNFLLICYQFSKFAKENAHFICNSKDHSNGDISISIDAS
jgi:hypothetical protein